MALVVDRKPAVMVQLALRGCVDLLASLDLEGRRHAQPALAGVRHDIDAAHAVDRVAGRRADWTPVGPDPSSD